MDQRTKASEPGTRTRGTHMKSLTAAFALSMIIEGEQKSRDVWFDDN